MDVGRLQELLNERADRKLDAALTAVFDGVDQFRHSGGKAVKLKGDIPLWPLIQDIKAQLFDVHRDDWRIREVSEFVGAVEGAVAVSAAAKNGDLDCMTDVVNAFEMVSALSSTECDQCGAVRELDSMVKTGAANFFCNEECHEAFEKQAGVLCRDCDGDGYIGDKNNSKECASCGGRGYVPCDPA